MSHARAASPGFDPDSIFRSLEAAAEEWAEARYHADLLEELQKTVLAEIATRYLAEGAKSQAHAETLARSDEAYRTHIEGMCAARQKANRTQARYRNLQVLAELRRTQESSARALTRP